VGVWHLRVPPETGAKGDSRRWRRKRHCPGGQAPIGAASTTCSACSRKRLATRSLWSCPPLVTLACFASSTPRTLSDVQGLGAQRVGEAGSACSYLPIQLVILQQLIQRFAHRIRVTNIPQLVISHLDSPIENCSVFAPGRPRAPCYRPPPRRLSHCRASRYYPSVTQ
jgi:hypothetical protein